MVHDGFLRDFLHSLAAAPAIPDLPFHLRPDQLAHFRREGYGDAVMKLGNLLFVHGFLLAREAGLSKRQTIEAIRIASIPEDEFEALIESGNPPTVTQFADLAIPASSA